MHCRVRKLRLCKLKVLRMKSSKWWWAWLTSCDSNMVRNFSAFHNVGCMGDVECVVEAWHVCLMPGVLAWFNAAEPSEPSAAPGAVKLVMSYKSLHKTQ